MIVLAIDTATPATVVGLRRADGSVLEARDDPRMGERPGHSTRLLPLAAGLLAASGLGWRDVERIAVGVGPGTFTGLRVGVSTAHGLAQSSGAELVGVSSLRALALGARYELGKEGGVRGGEGGVRGGGGRVIRSEEVFTHPSILAAIDARRGEVFVAGYQDEMELLSPVPIAPAVVPELLVEQAGDFGGGGCVALGDGAVLYRVAFERAGVSVPADDSALHRIRAPALCELGESAAASEAPVLPDYLRRPDAVIANPATPLGVGQAGSLEKAAS